MLKYYFPSCFLCTITILLLLAADGGSHQRALKAAAPQDNKRPRPIGLPPPMPSDPPELLTKTSINVYHIAFSPKTDCLVWCEDNLVRENTKSRHTRVWSLSQRRQVARLAIDDGVFALAFSPSGKLLAIAIESGGVEIWNTTTWQRQSVFGKDKAFAVAFDPAGKILACGYFRPNVKNHCELRLWEIESGRSHVLGQLSQVPQHLSYSGDGQFLAWKESGAGVKIWNPHTGKLHWSFPDRTNLPNSGGVYISDLLFHPDSRTLLTGDSNGIVRLWDVQLKKCIRQIDSKIGDISRMALSPDGKLLAIIGGEPFAEGKPKQGLRILDLTTGRQLFEHIRRGMARVCFSADGNLLAVGVSTPLADDQIDSGGVSVWKVADLIRVIEK